MVLKLCRSMYSDVLFKRQQGRSHVTYQELYYQLLVKYLRTEAQSWPPMIKVTTFAPIVMSLNVNKFSAGKVADDFTIELKSPE